MPKGRMKYLTPKLLKELDAVKKSKGIKRDCEALDIIAKNSQTIRVKKISVSGIIEELL